MDWIHNFDHGLAPYFRSGVAPLKRSLTAAGQFQIAAKLFQHFRLGSGQVFHQLLIEGLHNQYGIIPAKCHAVARGDLPDALLD